MLLLLIFKERKKIALGYLCSTFEGTKNGRNRYWTNVFSIKKWKRNKIDCKHGWNMPFRT
jgi:hypothetical protein